MLMVALVHLFAVLDTCFFILVLMVAINHVRRYEMVHDTRHDPYHHHASKKEANEQERRLSRCVATVHQIGLRFG